MKQNGILRRRLLSLLLVAAMLLCNVTAALADTSPCIALSSGSVTQGNSVDLYLDVENAAAISAIDLYLRYDSGKIRFSSGMKYSLGDQPNVMFVCSEVEPGLIHLMLLHPGTDGLSGTGTVACITFSTGVNSDCGTYPVEVIVNDVLNTADQALTVSGRNGSIQIMARTANTLYLYSGLSASSVNVGDEVQFSVYAYELYNLVCGKFVFLYDDAVLELKEPVQCGSMFENSYCDVNQTNPGVLSVSVISDSAVSSYNWNVTLFTLTFIARSAGEARISCSAEQLLDDALQSLNSTQCSAQLNVVQPAAPVVDPALRLEISKDEIFEEDQFDVTLKISEGSGLAALDVIVEFDDSVLQCSSCTVMETGTGQLAELNSQKRGQVEFSFIGTALTDETVLLTMHMTALSSSQNDQEIGLNVLAAVTEDFRALTLDAKPLAFPIEIPRVHGKWQCSASGTTITAACGHKDCSHTETATLTVPDGIYTYDGKEKKPAIVTYSDGFPDRALEISYTANVNVGTASASIAYKDVSVSTAFTIIKAAQSITAEAVQSFAYGDTGKSMTAAADYENAALHYAVKNGNSVSVNADTGALTILRTGDTVITITAAETANYKSTSREVTVSVGRKAIVRPTENTADFTYTGEKQTYVPTGFDADTMTVTGNEQTDAGTYTVTVTPKENYVWNTDGVCTFAWTIQKAEVPEAQKRISGEIASTTGSMAELRLYVADENAVSRIESITGAQGISGKIENGELVLTVDTSFSQSVSGFTVNVGVSGCKNYEDYTAVVDVTVLHQSIELGQTASEGGKLTVPVRLAYDVPTKVSFVAAGYDAGGRMLCTAMKTLTVSGEMNTVTLELPKNTAANSAATWRIMALDAGAFFPLGQAA